MVAGVTALTTALRLMLNTPKPFSGQWNTDLPAAKVSCNRHSSLQTRLVSPPPSESCGNASYFVLYFASRFPIASYRLYFLWRGSQTIGILSVLSRANTLPSCIDLTLVINPLYANSVTEKAVIVDI